MSLVPCSSGKLLVWDITCLNMFALSYRGYAAHAPGEVAAKAEERKVQKYQVLPASHLFMPLAIETMGALGPRSLVFVKQLGRRIRAQSGERKSTGISFKGSQGQCKKEN